MSLIYHERPGVYSDYDASSVSASGATERVIALIGTSTAKSGLYTITSEASGKEAFGETSQLGVMVELAYRNGAGKILACPVASDTLAEYQAACKLIFEQKQASFCVIGSAELTVQTALRGAVAEASSQKGECIGLVGMGAATVQELCTRAQTLNSERMVLLAPQVYRTGQAEAENGWAAAAALAGALCDQSDPALPLNGQVLRGLEGVTAAYTDTEYDALVGAGVTALECVGGEVNVIRALTTRTKTGGSNDVTFRELGTMLVVDEVIPAIRAALRRTFTRAKNNQVTRNAIKNRVIIELEDRIRREIIDGYDHLTVTPLASDPTVCVVEFTFSVVYGLNRIYLTAHINV